MLQKNNSSMYALIVLGLLFMQFRSSSQIGIETSSVEDHNWREMVQNMTSLASASEGNVGIYIKDLRTGKKFEYNADQQFVSASLIKLPIMAATFQAIRDKKLAINTTLTMKYRHIRGGSGRLSRSGPDHMYAVSHLIYKMITESDNTATAILIDHLGYQYLNRCFRDFQLNTTRIDPVGMSLADHIHPARDNYTTPREMGDLLEKIYNRKLVSDGLSDLMIEILKKAGHKTRLAQFLPKDWEFARKTGLLRGNCHDVGIVFSENGDYIICILTKKITTYKKAKGLIASLGKTAYSYMGHS